MTAPVQSALTTAPVSSGGIVTIAPPTAGNILVAIAMVRGTSTGARGVTDNIDTGGVLWDEVAGSPYENQTTSGFVCMFTKVATGGETAITISTSGSGNKAQLAVFECVGNVGDVIANEGNTGVGSTMNWSTGDMGDVYSLVIGAINMTADDLSHDYNGTGEVGTVEIIDGTIADDFSPGFWIGYQEDSDGFAGTWNHFPQGYVALSIGIAGITPPIEPGPIFSVDGVAFDNLLEARVRFEFNAPGAGYMVLSRDDPQAVPAMVYRGAVVECTFPEIHPDPIFEFYLDDGDFDAISSDEEGGEELRFGGPGTLSILRRAIVRSEEFLDGTGQWKPNRGVVVFNADVTEGHILNKLIREAQADDRPARPLLGMTRTFDSNDDSDNEAWNNVLLEGKWRVKIGANLYDAALRLVNSGLMSIEMYPGLVLNAWRSRGTDRHANSFAAGKVLFVKGVNIVDELSKGLAGQHFATHAEVKYIDNDDDIHYINATKDAGDFSYDKEVYIESEASHANTARRQAKHAMKLREDMQDAIEFAHVVPWPGKINGDPLSDDITDKADEANGWYLPGPPYSDHGSFWLGDLVTLHTGTGSSEFEWNKATKRVYAITLYKDATGYLAPPIVELNAPHKKSGHNRVRAGISGTLSDIGSGSGGGGGGGSGSPSYLPLSGGLQPLSEKGDPDGYASLDTSGQVPAEQIAGGTDALGYVPVAQGDGTVVWSAAEGVFQHVEVVEASGSVELDFETALWWDLTLVGDVTYTIVNAPPAGSAGVLHVIRRQGAGAPHDETWPGTVSWQDTDGTPGGPPVVLFTAVGAINHAVVTTFDEGTSYGASDIVMSGGTVAEEEFFDHGAMGTTEAFDPADGNAHVGELDDDCTATIAAPAGDGPIQMEWWITQDGTGGHALTIAATGGSVVNDTTPDTTAGVTVRYVLDRIPGSANDWIVNLVGAGGATSGRWELAVIPGSPPDPLYADGDFLYIFVP